MSDELKDQRVVTMMSPTDLKTIDDWMFKNRIRSRGEAIRRLCQIGMQTSSGGGDLYEAAFGALTKHAEARDKVESILKNEHSQDAHVLAEEIFSLYDYYAPVITRVLALTAYAEKLGNEGDVTTIGKEALKFKEEIDSIVEIHPLTRWIEAEKKK